MYYAYILKSLNNQNLEEFFLNKKYPIIAVSKRFVINMLAAEILTLIKMK